MTETTAEKPPTPQKRPGIMARLGLERPAHYNGMIGWFETLASAWISYGLFWGCVIAWQRESITFLAFPLLTALILYLLMLLTTRQANIIAYWIFLAFLMGASTKLVRKISPAPLEAIAAQPLGVWLGVVLSLCAALLLLLPVNRLWIGLRRMELKRNKTTRETVQHHLYDRVGPEGELFRTVLIVQKERIVFDELCADLPEQGNSEFSKEHILMLEDHDTVPLVMALRQAAKINTLPKGDLTTVLKESADAALKVKSPSINDLCKFLVEHRISWKTALHSPQTSHGLLMLAEFDGGTRKLTDHLKND